MRYSSHSARKSNLQLAASAIVVALLVTGCGSDSPSTEAVTKSAAPAKVKVVVGTISTTFTTHFVADQLGYFGDAGLSVETVDGGGQGQNAVSLVQKGDVDMAFTGAGVPANANSQGLNLQFLNFDLGIGASAVIVRKDLYDSGEIREIKDLDGRRIGTHQPGSVNHLLALNLAAANKIEYAGNMFTTQTSDTLIQALESKQVDAIITAAYAVQATGEFGTPIFVPSSEAMEREFGAGYIPGFAAVWATSEFIEKQAPVVKKYVQAMSKAQKWMLEHDSVDIAEVVAAHPSFSGVLDAKVLTTQLDALNIPELMNPDSGYIDESAWDGMVAFLSAGGTLQADRLKYADVVDMSFVPAPK